MIIKNIIIKDYYNYNCNKLLKLKNKVKQTKCKPLQILLKIKYNKLLFKNNCFLPYRVEIGDNITFPHGLNGIFISKGAKIGNNCTIFQQVTIGSNSLDDTKSNGSPNIGNNVYIGAGAKIIGGIKIGDNVRIGANAIVIEDIPDNCTVVLNKSRIIEHKSTKNNSFKSF